MATDRLLDSQSSGARWLEQPPIANLVAEAIEPGARVLTRFREFAYFDARPWIVALGTAGETACPTLLIKRLRK